MITRFTRFKNAFKIFVTSVILASLGTQMALAYDVDFFASNDIIYYDPSACDIKSASTGGIALQGNDVAEKVFRFLTTTPFVEFGNKPFNAIQAAGALGNFQQESGMDPGAVEGNGEGHGLAQWSFGRKTVLFDLAKQLGKNWSDLDVQIQMMKNELDDGYGKSLLTRSVDGKLFPNVTTPKDASYVFQKIYESAGIPAQEKRDKAAQAYYDKFKDLAPSSPTAGTGSSVSNCASTTSDSNFSSDGFIVYNQFDSRWKDHPYGGGTIGGDGCGPSAMAMIITALTSSQVTPIETADYAASQGQYTPGGTKWTMSALVAKQWNLNAKNISGTTSAINQVLSSGGLVITSGSGPSPFTSGGHFIVIRGVTAGGKWKIGDSNGTVGQTNSTKEWDPALILQYANPGNIVAITK